MALAAALWSTLPHGDTAWDLMETVAAFAFTEPMNTGGTLSGVPMHVGSESSSWTQTSYRLGLTDITDPGTGGRPLLFPDLSSAKQVQVKTSVHDLQTGAPGPVLTLVPQSGGADWTRTLAMAVSPSAFQANGSNATAPMARLDSLGRVEGSVGGSLTSRTRLFASAAGTWSSHNERGEGFTLPGNVLSVMAHPTIDLAYDSRASAIAWVQQTRTAFAARALLRDRHAAATQFYGGVFGGWQKGVRTAFNVNGVLASTRVTPEPDAGAARGTVERLIDDPIETLVASTGGSRTRAGIAASVTTPTRIPLKGGVSLFHTTMRSVPFGTGPIGETLNGLPARIWDYGLLGESHRSSTSFAMYGSARGRLIHTLEFDGGLRLEHVSGGAQGAAAGISWTSFEPRAALHYKYDDRWSGSITARRYHPVLPLSLMSAGDPAAAFGRSFLWNDRNGDRQVQDNERGALVSLEGPGNPTPGFSTIDPGLKRPYVDELQVAIDVRIKPTVAFRFSGISRRGGDLLARYNDGVPFEAYTVQKIFDPGLDLLGDQDDQMLPIYSRPPATFGLDRYALRNIEGVNSTYGGLYLALMVERSPRWHLLVAATALHSYAPAAFRGHLPSQNDELVIGDSYTDPNSNTYSEGRTLFDRGYGLKVAASYTARRRWTIAAVGRYADGQNFARLVIMPDLPQGPDAIRAFANGKTKFTYTATLDLRLQKVLTVAGREVTLGLESYNTTNLRNEVEEDMVTGPNWRKSTFTQPPRVIRLTAGVTF